MPKLKLKLASKFALVWFVLCLNLLSAQSTKEQPASTRNVGAKNERLPSRSTCRSPAARKYRRSTKIKRGCART
jgi:hypothetical protein